jgi:two-component system response regulator HydG
MPRLFASVPTTQPLIGVVADSGQIARLAVRSEVDFLLALGAGVYRTRGFNALAVSMPFGNVNDLAEQLIERELLPHAQGTPIIAGLLANDPTQNLDVRLQRLVRWGVFGVANYPSTTLLDGSLKQIAEEEGNDFDAELALLHDAKQHGLATVGFVCTEPDIAAAVAAARVDALILSLGLTRVLDDIHERRDQLQLAIRQLNGALQAARRVNPALPCLAFGGPITMPEDLEQLYRQSSFDGFVGGSVFARLPLETSVTATIRRFQGVAIPRGEAPQTGLGAMLGGAPVMQRLFRLVQRAAACDLNV